MNVAHYNIRSAAPRRAPLQSRHSNLATFPLCFAYEDPQNMTKSYATLSAAVWLACAAAIAAAPNAGAAATTTILPPSEDRDLARDMLKTLVEIDTSHAMGSTAAAKAIQAWMTTAGFAAADVTFIAPEDHPTKGNLIVRYRGRHPGTPVLFLGHLDVVDANPKDWSVDPFKLTQKDGYFYGRGSIDMKDGDAALAENLIRLKREHFVPDHDLIVAFTADEEAGGDSNGPAFLLQYHRDLVEAGMVINLDGGGGTLKDGKPLYFEFGTSEKTYLTYTLETTSAGGHGSLPGPDNAIYRLGDGLGRLQAFKFPVMLTATTRSYFNALANLDSGPETTDMKAVAQADPDPAAAERLSNNVFFNAQLRTTCVATLISGGHAENALPQRARATVQCRMMPGDAEANVRALLVGTLNDPAIEVTLDAAPIVSPESAPTPKILTTVATLAHSMWPGVPVIPTMATGYSDDRRTRNAGIPSYDVSGVFVDAGENRAHGRDERIGAESFDESVEFTYRLLKSMGRYR
jgi:acetylornithine deacetylase/succinyl-diaminopimelate desuccinylase-like protein